MRVVIDVECDRLVNPTKVWLIVCKDVTTGAVYVFREPTEVQSERDRFVAFVRGVTLWIGHNWLEFDYPVLVALLGLAIPDVWRASLDTLVLSRLFNYSDPHGVASGKGCSAELARLAGRHSIDSYGLEFGLEKLKFNDFSKYSKELEEYCLRDVEICEKVYRKFEEQINDPKNRQCIELEQHFQLIVNSLQQNGFAFNQSKAEKLLQKVVSELEVLDKDINDAFRPKLRQVREIYPKLTQHGTLHKGDFRWYKSNDLSEFNGGPFSRCQWVQFNPSSHKQIVDVLTLAGWSPTDKTASHIEAERNKDLDKLDILRKYGWKVNEQNLSTLPTGAPVGARLLAKRILLESRRRTLTEWLSLVREDGRIHGKFYGIGAWTHRMAHQQPNTANIPNEFDTQGKKKLLGKEMRSLWIAPKNRLLVGVDAEGIQLRIFAHYINDQEFTEALVKGRKDDKTDPHSLNQRILGSVCRSRAAGKRFIYALLLGAGLSKLAAILECSQEECQEALDRLVKRYQGFEYLKQTVIPKDAKNGYFYGLDGRKVYIPGRTLGERKHLCMSGYLQNGEAVCMKLATVLWIEEISNATRNPSSILSLTSQTYSAERVLESLKRILPNPDPIEIVNFVHDEWQTETPNNLNVALWVAETQSRALQQAGEQLNLHCPLAGSCWSDEKKDYTIGTNWSVTH